MNISALFSGTTSSLLGNGTAASQASTATGTVSPFLAQAEQRIQADADITTAQISQFGLLKSTLSDGQGAAKAMSTLSQTSSAADATAAMGNFFNTFNSSVSAANAASTATGSGSDSDRAKGLVQELKSALSSDPAMADAMKKLGLSLQPDGSLFQDPKKFAAAFVADPSGTLDAMAKVGSKVDSVSSKELGSGGSVGTALAALSAQSTGLAAQQSAMQALDQTMAGISGVDPFTSTDATSGATPSASLIGAGLAAYQSNMTGI